MGIAPCWEVWTLPMRRASGDPWIETAEAVELLEAAIDHGLGFAPESGGERDGILCDAWAHAMSVAGFEVTVGETVAAIIEELTARRVLHGRWRPTELPVGVPATHPWG